MSDRLILPPDIVSSIHAAPLRDLPDMWRWIETKYGAKGMAALGRADRFYLLTRLLNRPDAVHPWLYARCREVEAAPDDHLDLWARFHYKSTIITFAGVIQEVLIDPEITVAILCYGKSLAIKMLGQIKSEFETNTRLKEIYSDVLWQDPQRDAPRVGASWTQNKLDVIRKTNPKESTIEAHGLTDGQPTGSHFALRVYDDTVTRESVTGPDMVKKTTECWELSDNLKSSHSRRRWHIGTRYSFADTYGEIMDRGILTPRIYPATHDGTPDGEPVFLDKDLWEETKITQRTTLSAQLLQNPSAGNEAMFKKEELKFIDIRPTTLNVYIMVDPASSKKKGSDRTAMVVLGVDAASNKYLLDGYCHKMSLPERWVAMKGLRKHWQAQPGVQMVHVGYERFGMHSDMEHFEEKMQQSGDVFSIKELNWPQDSPGAKIDRIQRLVPDFGYGKFYLPAVVTREIDGKRVPCESSAQMKCKDQGEPWRILKPVKRRDHEGNLYSLSKMFLDEYLVYPFSKHDDFLDVTSRLYDMDYLPPIIVDERMLEPDCE